MVVNCHCPLYACVFLSGGGGAPSGKLSELNGWSEAAVKVCVILIIISTQVPDWPEPLPR